jgi:hypothetical protein
MPRVRAEINAEVMAMVEAAIAADPDSPISDLHERAGEISPDVGRLSVRQFHARYPLQIKRKRNRGESRPKRPRAVTPGTSSTQRASGIDRDSVRQTLLQFASDLENAEQRKDLVRVLANIDHYVDRVASATD